MLDSVERILRAPSARAGWFLLALRLSQLPPPGALEYHRRVAATLLGDAAERAEGRLFALANGDIGLLFRPSDAGAGVMATISRLFEGVADLAGGPTLWPLPEEAMQALSYITALAAGGRPALPRPEPQASPSVLAAMDTVVQTADVATLMHRQTAVLLRPGQARQVTALYREVGISTSVLEARFAMPGQIQADPFLFSHLAAQLDRRMMAALVRDIPAGGPLSAGLRETALHINLTLSGILSDGYATLSGACRPFVDAGLRIGVEVQLTELFADPRTFVIAREKLRLAGLGLVLDGVTHQALRLIDPGSLEPELVKLIWSPVLFEGDAGLDAAIRRVGAERIVLQRAESEAAVVWGLAHGVQRFQGRYVDTILAAERIRACSAAAGCTVRQCTERAAATGMAGRTGCTNLGLLDLGTPLFRRLAA